MRINLADIDARRLLVPGPVVLVTTKYRGATNVMPLAWAAPASLEPPLVAIALHPSRHTHDMIERAMEFALNIPGRDLLNQVLPAGGQGLPHLMQARGALAEGVFDPLHPLRPGPASLLG